MARRYRDVAQTLLHEIVDGKPAQHDWLPREAELEARFGCSRQVIREAIRWLEERRLVGVRSAQGQHVLSDEGWDLLDPAVLELVLRRRDSDRSLLRETIEAVRVIEVEAGQLATRRARDGDFEVLAGELSRMHEAEEPEQFIQAQVTFHHALLLISGNRVLAQAAEPLQRTLARLRHAHAPERTPAVLRQHERILAALRARDAVATTGALGELADQLERWLLP
jgi:GntR family transcriptional regulator, transcriptional repressor for pyruvate dehydrogenase complex